MDKANIFEKVLTTLIIIFLILSVLPVASNLKMIDKCKDNNAVAVKTVTGYVCVRNTAITEVN